MSVDVAIVCVGHARGVLNYVFLSSDGIKPGTRQAINLYTLCYSFVGFFCVQVCDHCSSKQLQMQISFWRSPVYQLVGKWKLLLLFCFYRKMLNFKMVITVSKTSRTNG